MGYTVNGIKYDYDSITNQEIKRKLVARDIYCCVSSMTEYILNNSWGDEDAPFSYDDVTNFYMPECPKCSSIYGFDEIKAYKCGNCHEIFEDKPEFCPCYDKDEEEEYEDLFANIKAHKCESCGHIVKDKDELDTAPQEIYEWWMVSDLFAKRLEEKGECVLIDECIWGRGCTGQAILLDWVISQICFDMEILEGQQNEWSVK